MRLVRFTTVYPFYLDNFYTRHPELLAGDQTYAELQAAFAYDAFGQADFWSHALAPYGYEVLEITANAEPVQRAWAREKGLPEDMSLEEIALAQVKEFKPDILWFVSYDAALLQQLKQACDSIRLVLGWVGSAITPGPVWREMDLVLSCAPEAVGRLQDQGLRAAHMHHAFEPRVNERLADKPANIDLSFIGQLTRGNQYHLERERILESVRAKVNIAIYTPSADIAVTRRHQVKFAAQRMVYGLMELGRSLGLSNSALARLPMLGKAALWPEKPFLPVNLALQPYMRPPVFGLEMFQALKDSKATLNIHADSSPRYASNMRLWEGTGVGTCLVTDWKENISDLFVPDREIVTYRSVPECIEKVKWLLQHPKQQAEIAKAGQARTLREHTFAHRAGLLAKIMRRELKRV